MSTVTIGFSLHRTEMVPNIVQCMRSSDALFLEEPPTEEFSQMLTNHISIEEYMLSSDLEYPEFTRTMCAALRSFHSCGKEIIQVEPYLANLLALNEFLADGGTPDDLDRNTISFLVYLAEKKATGALISYYQASVNASFDLTIETVKNFARADATRFRLRDSLRAQELTTLIPRYTSSFVEAGMMHFSLRRLLKQQISEDSQVQSVFLTDKILQDKGKRRHLYSPGDQLTFLYIFDPDFNDKDREYILSSRALIYSKIICKEELSPDTDSYPHLLDELLCIDVTQELSVDDCYQLFSRIRGAGTFDSRHIVADHLLRSRPQISEKLKRWMP